MPHATCCKQASRQASEHNTLLTARSHLLQVKEKRWRWRWQRFTVLSLRRFYSSLAAGATAAAAITTTATATATGASAACNKSQFKWRPSMRGQNGARCLLLAACHMPHAACQWFALALAFFRCRRLCFQCSFVAARVKFVAEPVERQPHRGSWCCCCWWCHTTPHSCHIFEMNCTLRVR